VSLDMAMDLALGNFNDLDLEMTLKLLNRSAVDVSKQHAADPSAQGLKLLAALQNRMRRDIGILCLCENRQSILMWSHYAENHKGFLVGFESSDPFFSHRPDEPEEIGQLTRVRYAKKRPSIHVDVIENRGLIPDFLFSKNEDWSYEREWRVIRFLKNASRTILNDVYLFEVPATAIREIVLGANADSRLVEGLASAARNPDLKHVKFSRADLSRTEYEMDIVPRDTPQHFNEALAWLRTRDESRARPAGPLP